MSGSRTSSNPPQLIFASWPVATPRPVCSRSADKQDDGRVSEREGETEKTHSHTSERTARKEPRAGQESAALILNSLHFGEGLETVCRHFFGLGVGFEAHKRAQNSITGRGVCVDKSRLKPPLLWVFTYSSYFAVHWPPPAGSQLNSWLVWFIRSCTVYRFSGFDD